MHILLEISKPVTSVTGCFLLSVFRQLIVPPTPAQSLADAQPPAVPAREPS